MAKADFVTSVVLILLGVGAFARSLGMPRFAHLNVDPYTVPGIVPGILGLVLTLLGTILFVRAYASGGWRLDPRRLAANLFSAANKRLVIGLVLTVGYAAGLVGRLPYWLATVVFVFLFIAIYEWHEREGTKIRPMALATAGIQAVVVAIAVTAVFQLVFLVRLP